MERFNTTTSFIFKPTKHDYGSFSLSYIPIFLNVLLFCIRELHFYSKDIISIAWNLILFLYFSYEKKRRKQLRYAFRKSLAILELELYMLWMCTVIPLLKWRQKAKMHFHSFWPEQNQTTIIKKRNRNKWKSKRELHGRARANKTDSKVQARKPKWVLFKSIFQSNKRTLQKY